MKKNVLIILALLVAQISFAQRDDDYDIKYHGQRQEKKCSKYLEVYKSLPKEVSYNVTLKGENIIFSFPGKAYFDLIFDKSKNGIAVDVMTREQFECFKKNDLSSSMVHQGHLMPPMYKKDMLERMYIDDLDNVYINYGILPPNFDPNNIELNLLLLQKKHLCGYHVFSNLKADSWELLKTGLYRDSLSVDKNNLQYKEITKRLTFSIPFKKNKARFDFNDIKPLYDSLALTDYNIKRMKVRAYTSIEGSVEHNETLQQARIESIVNALQTYQTPEIKSYISTRENWVEFIRDIQGTSFQYLNKLNKHEIKERLKDKELLKKLEPLLSKHRKALIALELKKRFSDDENNPEQLAEFFKQSVKNENIDKAIYIQQIIFEKINDEQLPEAFIHKLEVPESAKFGGLMNNFAIFDIEKNNSSPEESIHIFEELERILPGNAKVAYNLISLRLQQWANRENLEMESLYTSIRALSKTDLNPALAKRLLINYHILMTYYAYEAKDYKQKNKSLKAVYDNYRTLNVNDKDLLSLAKYLSIYRRFDWAESVLYKRAYEIGASKELIFYYIRLTINNPKIIKQSKYRSLLLNAIEKDKKAFCHLFSPTSQGGYTFQLLREKKLKETYCENCSE